VRENGDNRAQVSWFNGMISCRAPGLMLRCTRGVIGLGRDLGASMSMAARIPVLLAVILAGTLASAGEYQATLTFHELLGFTWADELVHRDVQIGEAGVAAATLAMRDPAGKAVPVQVEVLEGDRASVRRARVWFKATLPKDETVSYRLTWSDEGRASSRPATSPVGTSLLSGAYRRAWPMWLLRRPSGRLRRRLTLRRRRRRSWARGRPATSCGTVTGGWKGRGASAK